MYTFNFGPYWFLKVGIAIELFSLVTLLLIAFFTFRYYRVDPSKRQRFWLSLSFLMMAASFVAKLTTYITLYIYNTVSYSGINQIAANAGLPIEGIRLLSILNAIGMPFFLFLNLLGWFLLLTVTQKVESPRSNIVLLIMSFFFVAYGSNETNLVYHIFAFALLGFIVYRYARIYRKNNKRMTLALAASFATVAVSQAMFIFANHVLVFIAAEFVQLIAYICLLVTFIAVLRYVKKK